MPFGLKRAECHHALTLPEQVRQDAVVADRHAVRAVGNPNTRRGCPAACRARRCRARPGRPVGRCGRWGRILADVGGRYEEHQIVVEREQHQCRGRAQHQCRTRARSRDGGACGSWVAPRAPPSNPPGGFAPWTSSKGRGPLQSVHWRWEQKGPTVTSKGHGRPLLFHHQNEWFQGPPPLAEFQEAEPLGRGPGRKPRRVSPSPRSSSRAAGRLRPAAAAPCRAQPGADAEPAHYQNRQPVSHPR